MKELYDFIKTMVRENIISNYKIDYRVTFMIMMVKSMTNVSIKEATEKVLCQYVTDTSVNYKYFTSIYHGIIDRLFTSYDINNKLYSLLNSTFYTNQENIYAVDGSKLIVNSNMKTELLSPSSYQVGLCSLFTSFNITSKSINVQKMYKNDIGEREMFKENISSFPRNSIVIMDRGYWKKEFVKMFADHSLKFIMRLPIHDKTSFFPSKLTSSKKVNFKGVACRVIQKQMSVSQWNANYNIPEFNNLSDEVKRKYTEMREQLEFRINTYVNSVYILITNIDELEKSNDEIFNLYHRRWEIETLFDAEKNKMSLQINREQTTQSLIDKINFHTFSWNICSYVRAFIENHNNIDLSKDYTVNIGILATKTLYIVDKIFQLSSFSDIKMYIKLLCARMKSNAVKKKRNRHVPRIRKRMPSRFLRSNVAYEESHAHENSEKMINKLILRFQNDMNEIVRMEIT